MFDPDARVQTFGLQFGMGRDARATVRYELRQGISPKDVLIEAGKDYWNYFTEPLPGGPPAAVGWVPLVGSGWEAGASFANGYIFRGLVFTGLFITDIFLVKSLVTGTGKLLATTGLRQVGRTQTARFGLGVHYHIGDRSGQMHQMCEALGRYFKTPTCGPYDDVAKLNEVLRTYTNKTLVLVGHGSFETGGRWGTLGRSRVFGGDRKTAAEMAAALNNALSENAHIEHIVIASCFAGSRRVFGLLPSYAEVVAQSLKGNLRHIRISAPKGILTYTEGVRPIPAIRTRFGEKTGGKIWQTFWV